MLTIAGKENLFLIGTEDFGWTWGARWGPISAWRFNDKTRPLEDWHARVFNPALLWPSRPKQKN